MFLKIGVLFLCIVYVACDETVNSFDCQNSTVHTRNVQMEVSGCKSTDERCPLYRGTNHTVVFTFEPSRDFMNKTDSRVYGVFEKFSVPYGKKEDACAQATSVTDGVTCPAHGGFLKDTMYKRTSTFSVSKNYPMIQLKVRFSFYDRRSKVQLLCREVAVEIKEAEETEPDENNEA